MPVFKYFTYVGSALFVLLFVSNAYLTDDESNLRFDGSLYQSAIYAPRAEETQARRSFAFPATSRLPFASGKCLPCSSPTNEDAASVIRRLGMHAVQTGVLPSVDDMPCFSSAGNVAL